MSKNKLSKFFVLLSIGTLMALFFSVVNQSYNNLIKATTEIKDNPLTRNISPDLDLEIIDEIEKREELNSFNFYITSPSSSINDTDTIKEVENEMELTP